VTLWERVAGLPLAVSGYTLDSLTAFDRTTALVRLAGGDAVGSGEDVGLDPVVPADLPLAGSWTLGGFCAALDGLDLWPGEPPEWENARDWRRWAFESAALDLALRQAGLSLASALGRDVAPVRFVNSLGLGSPASVDLVVTRVAQYPSVGFKLDAAPDWSDDVVSELVALGSVAIVDFKGRYELPVEDEPALAAMYARVLAAFPDDVLLEDPHAGYAVPAERLSLDAPIHGVADIGAVRTINVKPSRIGSLERLLAVYEWCEAHDVAMYGGGMGELGPARRQIQLLAAIFHPDGPNDVAPSGFNAPALAAGLPASPLAVDGAAAGFG